MILGLGAIQERAEAKVISCEGGLAQVLADIERFGAQSEFSVHLSPEHTKQLEDVIAPNLGIRLYKTGPETPRACVVSNECVVFSGRSGEKSLTVRWDSSIEHPEIQTDENTRTLVLPSHWTTRQLAAEADPLTQKWTVGHSLHPFISDAQIAAERKSLDVSGLRMRSAQKEAVEAGRHAFDSGKKSFLYVAPTGTGKTEVLIGILNHEVEASRNGGRFHIMVAHQTELVDQFAGDLASLENAGKVRVLRTLDPEALLTASQAAPPAPVLVMTIQGLEQALRKLPPEKIALLRQRMGTLVFDEAHHLGAPTYLQAIHTLVSDNEGARLLGATATPLHREQKIQGLFNDTFGGTSYWAYLDHGAEQAGVERSASAVVHQLQGAIDAGELTPLDHFYVMDPLSMGSEENIFVRSDPTKPQSDYQIDPKRYLDVIKRVSPLIDRHRSGFIAANSIAEAERLTAALQKAMPNKHFAVFHGKLSEAQRAKLQARMRSGEDLFLVTVNLLDEGVNFPQMSLYIDLNRSLGVRQLLQRWGRVARLAVGKEGVEIATLTAWDSADAIRDKIALIEKLSENPAAFRGGTSRPGAQGGFRVAAVTDVDDLVPIDDATKRKELQVLLTQMRRIFEEQPQGNALSPLERITERVKAGRPLPNHNEDPATYKWLFKLPEDQTKWPTMDQAVRDAIMEWKSKRKKMVVNKQKPLERVTERVKSGRPLPSHREDPATYSWLQKLPEDQTKWPAMDDDVREAIAAWKKTLRSANASPFERIVERIRSGQPLPTASQDGSAYGWLLELSDDQTQWPSMDDEVRKAIVAWKATRRVANEKSPLQRITERVKSGQPISTPEEDASQYRWLYNLPDNQAAWPPMDEDVREAIIKWKAGRRKVTMNEKSPFERIIERVKEGKPIPSKADDGSAYQWLRGLPEDPSKWPPMDDDVKQAIIQWKATRRKSPTK